MRFLELLQRTSQARERRSTADDSQRQSQADDNFAQRDGHDSDGGERDGQSRADQNRPNQQRKEAWYARSRVSVKGNPSRRTERFAESVLQRSPGLPDSCRATLGIDRLAAGTLKGVLQNGPLRWLLGKLRTTLSG